MGSSVNSPDEKKKREREEGRNGQPGLCLPIVQLTRCQSNIVEQARSGSYSRQRGRTFDLKNFNPRYARYPRAGRNLVYSILLFDRCPIVPVEGKRRFQLPLVVCLN